MEETENVSVKENVVEELGLSVTVNVLMVRDGDLALSVMENVSEADFVNVLDKDSVALCVNVDDNVAAESVSERLSVLDTVALWVSVGTKVTVDVSEDDGLFPEALMETVRDSDTEIDVEMEAVSETDNVRDKVGESVDVSEYVACDDDKVLEAEGVIVEDKVPPETDIV